MNWFIKAMKQYADFKGRARRKEYWMFILFFMIIYFVLAALTAATNSAIVSIITLVAVLGMFVPALAVACRRMHDVGKSGWYMLIPIYSFILAITDSQPGENQYGPNPKDE